MDGRRFARGTTALVGVLGLAACATPVRGIHHDPRFTQAAIAEGGLAIGGVTAEFRPLSEARRRELGKDLAQVLRRARPDYPIVPSETVAEQLGQAGYEAALEEFRTGGALSGGRLDELREALPDFRYLLLARIEKDRVRHEEIEVDHVRTKITVRRVTVSVRIYDVRKGSLAWGGTARAEDRERKGSGDDLWGAFLAYGPGLTVDPDTPEPPGLKGLLESAFGDIAGSLPSARK